MDVVAVNKFLRSDQFVVAASIYKTIDRRDYKSQNDIRGNELIYNMLLAQYVTYARA